MRKPPVTSRRALVGVFAVLAVGGAVSSGVDAPSATAGQDPCAASQVAKTVGMVATSTGTYLDAHPETNQALTAISQQQPGPQTLTSLKAYFGAHPQEGTVMQQLQQPLMSLTKQCKLPLSLPQVMGLMQSAQDGAVAGGLPSLPAEAATLPAQAVAATPGTSGSTMWNPSLPGVTTAGSGLSGTH
jgi:heme-binding protein